MINTSDHLHLAFMGFSEHTLVCSQAPALSRLALRTRSVLGVHSLIKRWLSPLSSVPDPGPGWGASERRQAWSSCPRGSAQWWRQTCQPLLRKSVSATGAEGWAFHRRNKQKSTTHSASRFGKCLGSILVRCRREQRALQAEAPLWGRT